MDKKHGGGRSSRIFNVANKAFIAFRENKILTKICEFTVIAGC